MKDLYAGFETVVLPNGLTVYATHWPEHPTEMVEFLLHSGAEQDKIGLEGCAHFVEHCLSENASIGEKEIKEFFEDLGGYVDLGVTTYQATTYGFRVPADREILRSAFDIFSSMLILAKIKKNIEKQRKIIVREYHREYPYTYYANLKLHEHKMLYSGYWLERFISSLGNLNTVLKITQQDLQEFYDLNYAPQNISIVSVGGMPLKDIAELLSKSSFGLNKKGERTPSPKPVSEVSLPLESKCIFERSRYEIEPSTSCTYRTIAKLPGTVNFYAVGILNMMLNDILNDEAREHLALTYHIGSSRHSHRYFYTLSVESKGLAIETLDHIEKLVDSSLESLAVREDLFKRKKQRIIKQLLQIEVTSPTLCGQAVDELIKGNKITTVQEDVDNFEKVTMESVCNLLPWLIPQRRWTLIEKP